MILDPDRTVAAYDDLACDYDALYPDWEACAERSYETLSRLLPNLERASRILDCACGTGMECYALATHGHRVHGSDASKKMLERARHRYAHRGLDIPTGQCKWADLPEHFAGQLFDIVLCWGNSISHCESLSALLSSLQGMAAVLARGGTLVVESRDWERLVEAKPRFTVGQLRCHDQRNVIPIYIWDVRGMWQASKVEILFLELEGDSVHYRSHELPMYPIPYDDLVKALGDVGLQFRGRQIAADEGRYVLLATRP